MDTTTKGYVMEHRRGPLIKGLSHGPALELEARVAAARDDPDFQTERVAKRKKLQTSREHQANPGVHLRDLRDRSTVKTAAQKEDDREAKLNQKAALYDRLHSGQACSTSNASEYLVDFEKMLQEQASSASTPRAPPPMPSGFEPIEFRQRGLIQDEDGQVLRTGDFEQNQKLSADNLFDSLATDAKRGRQGIGVNVNLLDEHELRFKDIDTRKEVIAQIYREGVILPNNLGSDIREALEMPPPDHSADTQTKTVQTGKVPQKTKPQAGRKKATVTALQKAKEAVLQRQAAQKRAPAEASM